MAMTIAVESVKEGDRIELWVGSAPQVVLVQEIAEGKTIRTFKVALGDVSIELNAERAHTVNLTC